MIPMTRATGKGLGVTAQFHVWLDYLFSQQHRQASFLIAMINRPSAHCGAQEAMLLCHAAESSTALLDRFYWIPNPKRWVILSRKAVGLMKLPPSTGRVDGVT
jgi:hypothetical protein